MSENFKLEFDLSTVIDNFAFCYTSKYSSSNFQFTCSDLTTWPGVQPSQIENTASVSSFPFSTSRVVPFLQCRNAGAPAN